MYMCFRWKFLKKELLVKVTEGNTELPAGSLIIHGYSVSGHAKSEGEAVSNATILLFSEQETVGVFQNVKHYLNIYVLG